MAFHAFSVSKLTLFKGHCRLETVYNKATFKFTTSCESTKLQQLLCFPAAVLLRLRRRHEAGGETLLQLQGSFSHQDHRHGFRPTRTGPDGLVEVHVSRPRVLIRVRWVRFLWTINLVCSCMCRRKTATNRSRGFVFKSSRVSFTFAVYTRGRDFRLTKLNFERSGRDKTFVDDVYFGKASLDEETIQSKASARLLTWLCRHYCRWAF